MAKKSSPAVKLAKLKRALGDPQRKPYAEILRDLAEVRRAGERPGFYFERLLYREDSGRVVDFLFSREERRIYHAKNKTRGSARILEDKAVFDEHFRTAGFPLPRMLGQIRSFIFFRPDGSEVDLPSRDALAAVLEELVADSPTGVFAKPVVANKGSGARLITAANARGLVADLFSDSHFADYLFQEAIVQHPGMAALYPHSLNSLRVVNGLGASGEPHTLSVIVRMGTDGRPVDNAHAGGVFVGVDSDTGRLKRYGYRLSMYGGARFTRHPDTGIAFEGYEVPEFERVLALAHRALRRAPHLYVGWDVGVTPDGPLIIEGNQGPFLLMMEIAHGGLKASPSVRAFLDGHGLAYRRIARTAR